MRGGKTKGGDLIRAGTGGGYRQRGSPGSRGEEIEKVQKGYRSGSGGRRVRGGVQGMRVLRVCGSFPGASVERVRDR